jgi:predicted nucleotidyltransferase
MSTDRVTDPVPTLEALRLRREEILLVAAAHGAHNVRVFGSVARGEARPESDVDLLVDFDKGRSLWDYAALWRELQAMLGISLDLVDAGGLTDRDDDIRHDAVPL